MRLEAAPSLAALTTLRLGGKAIVLAQAETRADLDALPELVRKEGGTPFVLGRGSNLLAHDGDLPYVLLRWKGADGIDATPTAAGGLRMRVGADVALPRLVAFGAAAGCADLAALAGIPGCVGGGMAMNAGSYGREFGRLVQELTVFTPDHGVVTLPASQFQPCYRHTDFQLDTPWILVLDATLELPTTDRASALRAVGEHIRRKAATQPVRAATAGCVFRNPPGESAGKLLDAAGFRGARRGNVGFSSMHANFLVNHGNGQAGDALELLEEARAAVATRFQIHLEMEVRTLSC